MKVDQINEGQRDVIVASDTEVKKGKVDEEERSITGAASLDSQGEDEESPGIVVVTLLEEEPVTDNNNEGILKNEKREKMLEFWIPIAMNTIDFISIIISFVMSFNKVECCGMEDALRKNVQLALTIVFLMFTILDLTLIITKKEYAVTIFNPILGCAVTVVMAYSATYGGTFATATLVSLAQLMSWWVVYREWTKLRRMESPTIWTKVKQVYFALVGFVSVLSAGLVIAFLLGVYDAGGVCIWRDDDGYFQVTSQPEYCWICPSGLPADAELDWINIFEDDGFSIDSDCSDEAEYGTFCREDHNGTNATADFCFLEFSNPPLIDQLLDEEER